jgi:hypothetical protein
MRRSRLSKGVKKERLGKLKRFFADPRAPLYTGSALSASAVPVAFVSPEAALALLSAGFGSGYTGVMLFDRRARYAKKTKR